MWPDWRQRWSCCCEGSGDSGIQQNEGAWSSEGRGYGRWVEDVKVTMTGRRSLPGNAYDLAVWLGCLDRFEAASVAWRKGKMKEFNVGTT